MIRRPHNIIINTVKKRFVSKSSEKVVIGAF